MTFFTKPIVQVRAFVRERAGVCVCVLSCLFCFIVGSLYNGSRDGVLPLNNFKP